MTTEEHGRRRARAAGLMVLVVLALAGTGLRLAAFRWNDGLLHGDVNLHALAAREYGEHGRLHYPMKFDFREAADPEALSSPAILHPRGVPFVAGLLTRWSGADAYAVLRALSLAFGLGLLGLGLFVVRRAREPGAAVATFALLALAPLLVDYSGNGSPYAGAALAVVLAGGWLGYGPRGRAAHGVVFGLLAGLAAELHGTMVALPLAYVAFWIARSRELGGRALAGFVLAYLAARAPSYAWTWTTLETPVYPLSEWLRTYRFGLVEHGIEDGRVVVRALPWSELSPRRYVLEVVVSIVALLRGAIVEGSPFLWPLVALGLVRLRSDERLRAAALPFACFLAVVLVWAKHEQRYLVVLLPGALALAGLGWTRAGRAHATRLLAVACVAGTLVWFGAGLLREPPNRYYAWEATYVERYPEVRELALELERAEPGVVLGFDRSALGALYWHGHPYVDAPFASPPGANGPLVRRLVAEHDVRYVWTPEDHEDALRTWLPVEGAVCRSVGFVVLELAR